MKESKMATLPLTTGTDVVVGTSGDDVVNGTTATLNSSDRLDGGSGHDVLALFGPGAYDLSTLVQFTGFEAVDLTALSGMADLTLRDGVDLTVNVNSATNEGGTVRLANETVTL